MHPSKHQSLPASDCARCGQSMPKHVHGVCSSCIEAQAPNTRRGSTLAEIKAFVARVTARSTAKRAPCAPKVQMPRPRARGAGRPRAQASRPPAGDSSDDGPAHQPACPPLPTKLNIRTVRAAFVWQVMREHAEEIADVGDVIGLKALRWMNGECVAVAVADLVADGRVIGATGAGRIHAIEPSSGAA